MFDVIPINPGTYNESLILATNNQDIVLFCNDILMHEWLINVINVV